MSFKMNVDMVVSGSKKNSGEGVRANILCEFLGSRLFFCNNLNFFGSDFSTSKIIIFCKPLLLNLMLILLAKVKKNKIILDNDDYEAGFHDNIFISAALELCEKLCCRLADIVVVHNEAMKKRITKFAEIKKIKIIPQVLSKEFSLLELPVCRKGCLLEKKYYLYVASFTKGGIGDLECLKKTWLAIVQQEKEAVLLFAGEGKYKNKIVKTFEGLNIEFLGFLNPANLCSTIDFSQGCLIAMDNKPADNFRMSMKLIEYLSRNKKVYGKVIGATKREYGEFVCEDFSNEINKQKVVREKIISNHDYEKIAKQWQDLIKE